MEASYLVQRSVRTPLLISMVLPTAPPRHLQRVYIYRGKEEGEQGCGREGSVKDSKGNYHFEKAVSSVCQEEMALFTSFVVELFS